MVTLWRLRRIGRESDMGESVPEWVSWTRAAYSYLSATMGSTLVARRAGM